MGTSIWKRPGALIVTGILGLPLLGVLNWFATAPLAEGVRIQQYPPRVITEADCREDARCFGSNLSVEASKQCFYEIDLKRDRNLEWILNSDQRALGVVGWEDKAKGWVTYRGVGLKPPGNVQPRHRVAYECVVDATRGAVIATRILPENPYNEPF